MVKSCRRSRRRQFRERWILFYDSLRKRQELEQKIEDEDDDYDPEEEQGFPLGIQMISLLSKRERQRLKTEMPNLPQYVFMNQDEKKSFFKDKYNRYKRDLAQQKSTVKHTHNKKVKFVDHIDVKKFQIKESAISVSKGNIVKQKHSPLSIRTF